MSNIIKASPTELSVVTADAWTTLKNSLYPGANDRSVEMVVAYCAARGLDPMLKPVHIVPMYNKAAGGMIDVVLPGINLYRIQASRTGTYAGKSEPEFGPDVTENLGGVKITYPKWCRVTVKRTLAGVVCEFPAVEYWKENYANKGRDSEAPNAMWAKRPYGQLAKCAEAQALRMAFPEVAGDVTAEEMDGKSFAQDMPAARGPMLESVSVPAAPSVQWPAINPSGKTVQAKDAAQWVKWCTAFVATLESPEAVAGWQSAMQPHFEALEAVEAKAVEHVQGVASDRLDSLATVDEDAEQEGAEA